MRTPGTSPLGVKLSRHSTRDSTCPGSADCQLPSILGVPQAGITASPPCPAGTDLSGVWVGGSAQGPTTSAGATGATVNTGHGYAHP